MKLKINSYIISIVLLIASCNGRESQPSIDLPQDVAKVIERPDFSSDSAFQYIQHQVNFGPRVPGTEAHQNCSEWIANQLKAFGATVQVQKAQLTTGNNQSVPCYNIIASYKTESKDRILLGAHWDTRPWADQDNENQDQPILGANDGASGVGVLLEIARQIQKSGTETGIDIIFFDVEDSGINQVEDSYCLGSQYWGKNPHVLGYYAQKGILLDMVGAKDAIFTMEGASMSIHPSFVNEIWDIAQKLGHGRYFQFKKTNSIIDDHVYVFKYTRIPMIDIIHYDQTTPSGFGTYWHTHQDNMDIISKLTLQAVGETVLASIRNK
ncbi:MAG: M28 family peptidase [Chitinophagales bacterium]|nr:M28 family peptidase [Chitinophagales bacterium]MCZ2392570.1 M28 family peptidase [Chitinophagales bacterium]